MYKPTMYIPTASHERENSFNFVCLVIIFVEIIFDEVFVFILWICYSGRNVTVLMLCIYI